MAMENHEPQPGIIVVANPKLKMRPLIRDWRRRGIKVDVRPQAPGAEPVPDLAGAELLVVGFDPTPEGRCHFRRLRENYPGPVVLCLDRIDAKTEMLALESGVDACLELEKPASLAWARICALLRRERGESGGQRPRDMNVGDFTFRDSRREIYLKERLLDVSELQYDLLRYLVLHAGEVVTRDDISQALFKREFDGLDRTVDIHISRLRKVLQDDPVKPAYLKTVRGRGYLLVK